MKINKDVAEGIWLMHGKRIVGSILCVAGLLMACGGSRSYGFMRCCAGLKEASPEEFIALANKALN